MTQSFSQPAGSLRRAEFRGNASEYFGVWIVNILLTIVTFGIYSAWAKVRRRRYFLGNTFIDNYSFDYHARGIHIFIGRLIVFGFLTVYNVVAHANPYVAVALSLVMFACMPWVIQRSLRFNARVTSYRNVRFEFKGTKMGAFLSILLGSFVSTLSLGILAPFASRWAYRYFLNNLYYGDRPFHTDVREAQIYRGWVLPAILFVIGAAMVALLAILIIYPFSDKIEHLPQLAEKPDEARILSIVFVVYAVLIPSIIIFAFISALYRVALRNIVLNNTVFDGVHPLHSDMSRGRYIWIAISNTIVSILTLSLMRPWAAVREYRYMVTHTGISPQGDLGTVVAAAQASGSAVSAEFLDAEGFDFGF